MKAFDLTGKIVIVTGASRGIGQSIATELADAGATVVASSRKSGACNETLATIESMGGKGIEIPCHIGKDEDIKNLVSRTEAEMGGIDAVVCNAAVNPYYGPLSDLPDEMFYKTFDGNVLSLIRFARYAMPVVAKRGGGALVAISSIGSIIGSAQLGLYAASKAAMNSLVRSLAVEWGNKNIRINAILPGLVKTDFARALWDSDEGRERAKTRYPLQRIGEPEDIGPAAVFLVSQAAAWMTGQTIVIDGGNTIQR